MLSDTLTALLPQLTSEGICVLIGYSSSPYSTIDLRGLGGRTLYSFFLGEEINRYSPDDLKLIGEFVAKGQLIPRIEVEASWKEIGTVAQQLIERKFSGKAELHINEVI